MFLNEASAMHGPRSIHLLDVENLLGNARPTATELEAAKATYLREVGVGPLDIVVIACNHGVGLETGLTWNGCSIRWRSGPDGADLALLNVLDTEPVEGRFDRVVLGSGDGIFSDAVAELAGRLEVLVVTGVGRLARSLKLAAGGRHLSLHLESGAATFRTTPLEAA